VCNQGLGGFRGINPGFTHFGGPRGILGFGLFSPNNTNKIGKFNSNNSIIIIHNIILSIISISIQGGGYIGGI
jgi:hypothetical protein